MRVRHALGGTFLCAGFALASSYVAGCGSGEDRDSVRSSLGAPRDDAGVFPIDSSVVADGTFPDSGVSGPSGVWHFDDCSPKSTVLIDSSGNGANAHHRINSACVAGISGLGLAINTAKNVVEIPDDPRFALTNRIAVAAWINPTKISGTHPIVLKEAGNETAFELALVGGRVRFSVRLASGKTIKSSAPISANTWSHVGAFYDGQFVFLFLNGEQVGQVDSPGTLRDVMAPIRVGASTEGQVFDGVIDEIWISTNPVAPSDIEALACVPHAATSSISQTPTGAVEVGTTVNYSIVVTNNDVGFCPLQSYSFSSPLGSGLGNAGSIIPAGDAGTDASPGIDSGPGIDGGPSGPMPIGLSFSENPSFVSGIAPGQSVTLAVAVSATVDTDPGDYSLPFQIFPSKGGVLSGALDFDLATPTGCHVTTGRELMILDPSVVDDPVRTAFSAPTTNPSSGVWTFGRLMRDMAPTPAQAPAFTLGLFQFWLTDQTVNGFTVSARPAMQKTVLDGWPRTSDGSLDLNRAPLRLLAIVNRIDTRDLAAGSAGEARFVFGVLDGFGNPLQFTLIVEYGLPASTEADVLAWANAWHALGALPFPSEQYNAALEALTLKFSGRGVAPSRPNGSALDQLRTNETALSFQWELRQFGISPTTGLFQEEPIALTPDFGFNGAPALAQFINQSQAAILAGTDTVPLQLNGAPFLGGSVFNSLASGSISNNLVTWNAPGISDNEARFQFSLNTCNGCHGPDTNTPFLQINPRARGQEAVLSGFLTGTIATDQITGAPRPLNDLARRNKDLANLVCPPSTGAKANVAIKGTSIAKGIRRTH
jgi:hypothetical protein